MDSARISAARFVGRIGILAATLGVGVVIGGYGIAAADTDTDADTGRHGRSSSRPAAGAEADQTGPAQVGVRRGARVAQPAAKAASTGDGAAGSAHTTVQVKVPAPVVAGSAAVDRVRTAPEATTIFSATPAAARSTPSVSAVARTVTSAPVAVAPVTTAMDAVATPLSGSDTDSPLQSPVSWAALAVARRSKSARALAAGSTTVAAAATAGGTTTTVTWAWGTNPVLAFDTANDKLDFGWMAANVFAVTETAGSTKIEIIGNNHTYTLQGVPLSALTMTNIVAKDAGTTSKWQGLIAGAQTTQPTVSITDTTVAEGNSGTGTAAFTVTLSRASATAVTVGYSTANGTATAGQDYTAASGTLTFAPGVISQKLNVAVAGDTVVEPDETFTVSLANPSGAALGTATATASVTNDDTAVVVTPPTVSISNATVAEGNSGSSNLAFTVSLSKASTSTVTVGYSTANGTATAGQDYTAASGTLSFAPGVTSQQVGVVVAGDTAVEPDETLTVSLSNASGATIATASATGTIVSDDTATTPPATGDRWGASFYAPYVDMGGWPVPDLLALSKSSGATLFTGAFLQATPDGKLGWAGLSALEPGSAGEQARAIDQSIKALQSAGGDVMISLGGAAGTSLAQYYQAKGLSAQALADAYAGAVDTYGVNHLDFDIEGAAVAEPASIALHSAALKLLQQSRPALKIWYTLPVLPTGLTADGVNVVDSALRAGVNLAGVNVMAMDFGESAAPTSGPGAQTMGTYAIRSAEGTFAQLSSLYGGYGKTFGYSQLGVTPMIGVNDVTSEVFTVTDAQALEDYARAKGLGMLGFWSVTRDVPGTLGQATPVASGLSSPAGSFGAIFKDYGTLNVVDSGSASGTGTPVQGGTTTVIAWKWGTDTVLAFDTAKDKLDFGWFQPGNFEISETSGSTRITIIGNSQTYTLSGVKLASMSTGNIAALDASTIAKWQNAITAAGQTAAVVTSPTVSVANATVAEGNSGTSLLSFTVTLSKASTTAVTVNYATANGTATAGQDYTTTSGTLTFAPGVLSQQVKVAVTGDTTAESNETLSVTLSNPTGATLATATATGTITNDDASSVPLPVTALPIASTTKVLAAYFPEWGIYGRNFQVADIPGEQVNRVIYSFLNLTSSGEVAIYDSFAAVEKRFAAADTVNGEADQWYYPASDPRSTQTVWGNFNQLAELKAKYPHMRVSIAIGGWTLSSNFSTVASTAAGREKLANSIVSFLTTYQMFDGVDFDWEYPGGGGLAGNSQSPNDGANYAELLKVVRAKFDALGQQTGRKYDISVASPAGYDKIANFNLAGLAPSVDFFNVMAYDFHGTWETSTGHQSAFTGDPNGYDIKSAVGLYLAAGVDPGKIVLGAPLYTRGWSGVADGGDGGYLEKASGAAPGTFEAGVYDYKDLLAQLKDPASGWKLYWDDKAQAAYLYNPAKGLFSSFETPTSIAQKSDWAEAMGLGGMMFWDITNDAVGSPDSLVKAAYASWVLGQTMAAIRAGAPLPNEVVVGGDGVIGALPSGMTL